MSDPQGIIYWGSAPSVPTDPVFLSSSTTSAGFTIPVNGSTLVLSVSGGNYLLGQTLTLNDGTNVLTGVVSSLSPLTINQTAIVSGLSGNTMASGATVKGSQFDILAVTTHQVFGFNGAQPGYLCICVPQQIDPQINTIRFNDSPLDLWPTVNVVLGSDGTMYNVYNVTMISFNGVSVLGR